MEFAKHAFDIFRETTALYHHTDDVDAIVANPYDKGSIEHTLREKNWIDAVQWHLEDIIRDPDIDPVAALALKRRIDRSNQDRTDMSRSSTPISATSTPREAATRRHHQHREPGMGP